MNRQEAIKILKAAQTDKFPYDSGLLVEAMDMAISSLETDEAYQLEYEQPREITLEDVKGYCKPRCLTIITNELLYELTHPKIKALEQEPKTGHWIDCDNSDDYSSDGYDCSVCGVNAEYATSYCPNCGARMVDPQESEVNNG